ncbi:hypothetical protein SS50377_23691 [Spironucleus salmonicida]|uniref:Uncharacterized protein n=1 Tax=Spironucleus salmonicida TaxID=348837 RepID=V6LWS4_9EUKA|nr:hypothetical protein SS50377_23691 [Spironucleus salmonicida]|eukprot:EST48673.1 Hypothetical protein SS50377_11286 [Spironucleus salmonicida]
MNNDAGTKVATNMNGESMFTLCARGKYKYCGVDCQYFEQQLQLLMRDHGWCHMQIQGYNGSICIWLNLWTGIVFNCYIIDHSRQSISNIRSYFVKNRGCIFKQRPVQNNFIWKTVDLQVFLSQTNDVARKNALAVVVGDYAGVRVWRKQIMDIIGPKKQK